METFKIKSKPIYKGVVLTLALTILVFFLAEWFLDLKATTKPLISVSLALTLLLSICALRYPNSSLIRFLNSLLIYLIIEIHFLFQPSIYHVIIYWLPVIPIVGIITQGLRISKFWLVWILITHVLNGYYVGLKTGGHYDVTIKQGPFLISGLLFISGMTAIVFLLYQLLENAYLKMKEKNTTLIALQQKLEQKKHLLESYHKNLIHLSRYELGQVASQSDLFRIICSAAAQTLRTNRVSIWMLEENQTKLVRQHLFEIHQQSDDRVVLERSDFPAYFRALEEQSFIQADNARTHPFTSEFTVDYLIPLNIYSMLDCPIQKQNKTIGVICCEHVSEVKHWNAEDSLYLQSLADLISIRTSNEQIKQLLTQVQDKNIELVEKNNEIAVMNEELNALNEELTTLNESLEITVQNRTQILETQNKQLVEYAFINSHVLRAPLARILGLSRLLQMESNTNPDPVIIRGLTQSTEELDKIINKISDILYDGNSLTREDVQEIINRRLKL